MTERYELHELCNLFPDMGSDEFSELCEDIAANGLLNPIVLYEGKILDGRNRYGACNVTKTAVRVVEYEGDNPAAFVWSINAHRRHLDKVRLAAILASVQNWENVQGKGRPLTKRLILGKIAELSEAPATEQIIDKSVSLFKTTLQTPSQISTVSDRAAVTGVSERTQGKIDKVARADPALTKQVGEGKISLDKAVEQVSGKPKEKKPKAEKSDLANDGYPKDNPYRDLRTVYFALEKKDDEIAGLKEELEIVKDGHLFAELPDDQRPTAEGTITALRVKLAMRENEIAGWKIKHNTLMAEHADLNGRHNGLVAIHKKCPKEKPKEEEYEPF